MENIRFTVGRPGRLLLFVCTVVAGLFLSGVIALMLGYDSTPKARIAAVAQDLLGFALPAVVTAVIVTRRPADLMMIAFPKPVTMLLMLAALLAAVPAMNAVVEWNASLPLPESWLEATRAQQEMVAKLFGEPTDRSLLMTILIVGLMAPLTEELLFRGCLQRLFGSMMNRHVAVWLAAAVFSLFHFDMSGFLPRLLLGAIFGYAMIWSGSVWSAVACHALNNCLAVVAMWLQMRGQALGDDMQSFGASNPVMATGSAALTALLLFIAWRSRIISASGSPESRA